MTVWHENTEPPMVSAFVYCSNDPQETLCRVIQITRGADMTKTGYKYWAYPQEEQETKHCDPSCRSDTKEYHKEWYKNNKEKQHAANRKYRHKNKEKIKKYNREWYLANQEHIRQYQRDYRARKKIQNQEAQA